MTQVWKVCFEERARCWLGLACRYSWNTWASLFMPTEPTNLLDGVYRVRLVQERAQNLVRKIHRADRASGELKSKILQFKSQLNRWVQLCHCLGQNATGYVTLLCTCKGNNVVLQPGSLICHHCWLTSEEWGTSNNVIYINWHKQLKVTDWLSIAY